MSKTVYVPQDVISDCVRSVKTLGDWVRESLGDDSGVTVVMMPVGPLQELAELASKIPAK